MSVLSRPARPSVTFVLSESDVLGHWYHLGHSCYQQKTAESRVVDVPLSYQSLEH